MSAVASESVESSKLAVPVAIIGSGAVAHHHARHLLDCPAVKLVAVVDSNYTTAQAFADKWKVARVHGSIDELLSEGGVKAVHITTPPDSHEPLARKAIVHGLDVVIEKPVAFSASATAELYQLASTHGVRLVPDFSLHFTDQMCRAREWIAQGRIGRVVCVECLYQTRLDRSRLEEPKVPPWLFDLPAGPLQNFFTHPLYLVLQFTGPVRHVTVVSRHTGYLPQGLTDNLELLIDGEKCSAFVNVSLAVEPAQTRLAVHGEKGRIVIDFDSFQVGLESATARFGSVARLLRPTLRGLSAIQQTGSTALNILSKRLMPYAGLKALISRFYGDSRAQPKLPIPVDLVLEVAKVEDRIVQSPGVWKLPFPHACATLPAAPRPNWVAVTGGVGYLGSRVVAELRRRGFGVRLLTRWQSRVSVPLGDNVEIIYGDARNLEDVRRLAAGTEAIIHLAAGMRGTRQFIVESCVDATRNILQVARELGTRRNIYLSSMAVFDYRGLTKEDLLTEQSALETAPNERSTYAMGKTLAERLVAEDIAKRGSEWMILRPSQIFGGNTSVTRQLGSVIGRYLICLGGPNKRMRLVHVDDVVQAIADFLQFENFRSGAAVNLTHPDVLLARDLSALLRQQGLRVIYLRSWMGKALAWGTRLTHGVLKRGPRISVRQAAYLFCECGAKAGMADELHWKPGAPLAVQLKDTWTSRTANGTCLGSQPGMPISPGLEPKANALVS